MTLQLNMYHAVGLAAVLFWLGNVLTAKIPPLSRYCIPAPLVGGLCFAAVNTALYASGAGHIEFDDTLQTVFMTMFFCTVGFTVSLPMLFRGGRAVAVCLALATAMVFLQNGLGAASMLAFGQDPRLGLAVGSIALIGGPGTAASFGPELEAAGAAGGSVVGLAAATFGLVFGSLMGGPVARRLIVRYGLPCAAGKAGHADRDGGAFHASDAGFIKGFMLVMLCVGVGDWLCAKLTEVTGLTFPAYIGAMIAAAVVRNALGAVRSPYPGDEIETIGNMSLSLFLAMAMMGLKLWELVDLALPMLAALGLQILLMGLFSYFLVFRLMGRNYDAAVMTAGFIGFAMGATSNAMANMQAVTKKYGPSPTAYFAIPMVGSMFIDFINAVVIALLLPVLGALA